MEPDDLSVLARRNRTPHTTHIPSLSPTYRASPLTSPGLTSCYEKAQIECSYPYDTGVYCDSLLASPNPATHHHSGRALRPLGSLRHEGVVVSGTEPTIGMTSCVLTLSEWRVR